MKYSYIATICLTISAGMIIAIVPAKGPRLDQKADNPPPFIDPGSYGSPRSTDQNTPSPFYTPSKRINPDEIILSVRDAKGTETTVRTKLTTPIYKLKNQLAYSTTLPSSLGTFDQIQLSINGDPLDNSKTVGDYITQATMETTIINLTGTHKSIFLIKEGEMVAKPVLRSPEVYY